MHPKIFKFNKLLQNKSALFAIFILVLLGSLAIFAPIFSNFTYFDINLAGKNLPPSFEHLFGTDELGRDVFVRTWCGARISLSIGILAVLIDLVIGVLWGTIAAFMGGWIENFMMRLCDILSTIPYLLMVIFLMVILGPGIFTIIIAITITGWINMARIVRGQILVLKELDFINAAYAIGASSTRIIFHHLIPNILAPIITTMTISIPLAIFIEAFLSFLGLGVQAPIASWGAMINDGLAAMRYYPWRIFFPAFMLSLTMLSFNLIGNSLQEVFDPKIA
ncbi:MAG: ABC transporter permease [Chlamydiae bacterium]|nr:ABC transporter permease [Chlamydiota bacterium]